MEEGVLRNRLLDEDPERIEVLRLQRVVQELLPCRILPCEALSRQRNRIGIGDPGAGRDMQQDVR